MADTAPESLFILVVDDNPDDLFLIRRDLVALGHRVAGVSTANEALDHIARAYPDLLMTDVGLPGMDGRTLAAKARELRQTLPVLFASGYAETLEIAEGMAVIGKPFSIDQLRAKVKSMLINA